MINRPGLGASDTFEVKVNVQNIVNRGEWFLTRQSSLLYVFVLVFGLDRAQNTIAVYSKLRN